MKRCGTCEKEIDTRNDTFVMVREEDEHKYVCFDCYKGEKETN